MKATGIVRRIDDLGRVVIPKEIRHTMRIREGDPLEVYVDHKTGDIIFRKYARLGEIRNDAQNIAEALSNQYKCSVLVTDMDHVIAVSGTTRRTYLECRITEEAEQLILKRRVYRYNEGHDKITPVYDVSVGVKVLVPLFALGECVGSIILLDDGNFKYDVNEFENTAHAFATFIAKQMED